MTEPPWGAKAREHDWDLYSHWCHLVLREGPDSGRIEVGRYEQLSSDLLEFVGRHDIPVGTRFERALKSAPRVNASDRGPYRPYYDDELQELVRQKSRRMVDTYGYEF